MAKPNYAYEKRQRELEKKKKKEDKAAAKKSTTPSEPLQEELPGTAALGEHAASASPSDAPDR